MMKKKIRVGLSLVGVFALFGFLPNQASAAEITLTAASCFPIGSPPGKPFEAFVVELNARGKGVVQIDLKGGAPAIGSPFTLTQKNVQGCLRYGWLSRGVLR
jgi:hypothetical protein